MMLQIKTKEGLYMDMNQLPDNLVNIRKMNGLSQEAFAERIGVSRQAISNWERKQGVPDADMLKIIAKEFDVSIDTLITGCVAPNSSISEKGSQPFKYSKYVIISMVLILAIHIFSWYQGKVSIESVIISPGVITMISVIIHLTFRHVVRYNSYSILGGFSDEKDNIPQVRKQLNAIDLLNSLFGLAFSVIFFYHIRQRSRKQNNWFTDISWGIYFNTCYYCCLRKY